MTGRDESHDDITALLQAHVAGDATALERLLPRVYDELRRIARSRLRRERDDHTLAATELVHEAFLELLPADRVDWRSRTHFYAVASRAMRNVLIDHAVAVVDARPEGVTLFDPLVGPRQLTREAFERIWRRDVVLVRPAPALAPAPVPEARG